MFARLTTPDDLIFGVTGELGIPSDLQFASGANRQVCKGRKERKRYKNRQPDVCTKAQGPKAQGRLSTQTNTQTEYRLTNYDKVNIALPVCGS